MFFAILGSSFFNLWSSLACWSYDTHERPSFKYILKTLDDIARSKFQEMTGDNFYSMQDDWKVEIDEMLSAIRFREQVITNNLLLTQILVATDFMFISAYA